MNRTSAPAGHVASSRSGAGSEPGLRRKVVVALVVWTLPYACYRAYYAAGGEFGMIGQPVSTAQIRAINAVGAAIIGAAAILPLLAMRVRVLRRALPVLGWIAAVGCCMHALVDWTLRMLSLTGVYPTQLSASVWRSFDRRAADLQDLFLNEPWFFVEGSSGESSPLGSFPRPDAVPGLCPLSPAAYCSLSSAFSAALR